MIHIITARLPPFFDHRNVLVAQIKILDDVISALSDFPSLSAKLMSGTNGVCAAGTALLFVAVKSACATKAKLIINKLNQK
jgi:hypothetical protein